MKRHLCGSLLLVACCACDVADERVAHFLDFEGATMGTTYSVQIVDLPGAFDARRLQARTDGVLHEIERKMSTYDASSELSRFNASDSTDWFAVSAETLAVIEEAQRISRLTGGAFDVTVGPLVELWGFGPGAPGRPTREAIATALEGVGHALLETRPAPPAIRKRTANVHVDLSSIAKGFAVDEIARLLEEQGACDFLVEIGGELRAGGHNRAGEPWRIAVERPPSAERVAPRVLHLVDAAVASSGDYHNAFTEDGVRYPHVIDPRTGRPVTSGVACATVLSVSAMEADALATALMVLPPDEGLRLAEQEELAVRLLVRVADGFVERTSTRFPGRVPERTRP